MSRNTKSPLQTRDSELRRDKKSAKNAKIADFSGCETVKLTRPNKISHLHPKTPQFHSFCETVEL
jgi:hypothetical protein